MTCTFIFICLCVFVHDRVLVRMCMDKCDNDFLHLRVCDCVCGETHLFIHLFTQNQKTPQVGRFADDLGVRKPRKDEVSSKNVYFPLLALWI